MATQSGESWWVPFTLSQRPRAEWLPECWRRAPQMSATAVAKTVDSVQGLVPPKVKTLTTSGKRLSVTS